MFWDECGGLGTCTCTYLALRWGWGCRGVVASFIGVDWFGCFWLFLAVELCRMEGIIAKVGIESEILDLDIQYL